jgi:hypothetical protein
VVDAAGRHPCHCQQPGLADGHGEVRLAEGFSTGVGQPAIAVPPDLVPIPGQAQDPSRGNGSRNCSWIVLHK